MESLVSKRSSCRLCEHPELFLVLPIKASPIGDAFIPAEKKHIAQPLIPLDLYQCQDCGHVQNIDIVNPDVLFREYIFETASSQGLVEHFRKYARDTISKLQIPHDSFVVEIGSNDGTLLKFFKESGMKVLGIDPATDIANNATNAGIPTIPNFFTSQLAKKIVGEQDHAKLILANNVYAHSDHLADITDGIECLLDHDGIFIFEVSYLLDIIDKFLFDTVYHEHLSYHSIYALQRFFKSHNLHLFDIEKIPTKGGSIRCFVQKIGDSRKEEPIIENMIRDEIERGLNKPYIFDKYHADIMACKKAVNDFIDEAIAQHKRIAGYGASTTVTTLMYHFELENKLEYLIDDNTKKHGLLSPGCHLPVKPSSVLYEDKPDMVIILAWQYQDAIVKKHEQFLKQGGTFIIPLPTLKIIQSMEI
jgi:hypothetical protein